MPGSMAMLGAKGAGAPLVDGRAWCSREGRAVAGAEAPAHVLTSPEGAFQARPRAAFF